MKTKSLVLVAIGLFCSLALYQAGEANLAAQKEAARAANTWLALVDGGKYAKSWETAATYLKTAMTKDQWQASLTATRKPLGTANYRTLKYKKFTTTLPGAPDGEYVIFQFQTWFQNKKSAIETITPMRDRDGKWRVAGYYVK